MKRLPTQLLCWLASCAFLAAPVRAQQPASPQPARLADQTLLLDFIERGSRILAVGDRGTILRAGGHMASPSRSLLTAVAVRPVAESAGGEGEAWAVGHDKTILRLRDADGVSGEPDDQGAEWKLEAYDAGEREDIPVRWTLLDIHWFDDQAGLIVGSYGLIMHTADAGKTWSNARITWDGFVDEKDIAEDDYETLPDTNEMHLYKLRQSPDGTLFCAADEGCVFRSADSGKTWTKPDTGQFGSFYDVLPLDDKTIIAVGILGTIVRSVDGGKTWQQVPTETRSILHALVRARDGAVYALGDGGTRLKSGDQGKTFTADNITERVALTGGDPDGSFGGKAGGFLLTEKGMRPW